MFSKITIDGLIKSGAGLIEKKESLIDSLLKDRTLPVSEGIINPALAKFAEDVPELASLSLDIQEGSFELAAEVRKVVTIKSRTRFEITSCEISGAKQLITFRRISPTELSADKLLDRILIVVFKAIACGIFQIEPAEFVLEGLPGMTVNGDSYTVDLSQTKLAESVSSKIKGTLLFTGNLMVVKELRCVPKTLQVLIGKP
jgi:hypothetical protein